MIIEKLILSLLVCDLSICFVYARIRKKYEKKGSAVNNPTIYTYKKKFLDFSTVKSIAHKTDIFLYGLSRYTSICVGRLPSHTLRRWLYKFVFCMQIDRHAILHGGCEVRSPWNVKIGKSVIGVGAILDGRNGIEIEDDVVLATGVWIWTEQHDMDDPYFRCLDKGGKVTIKHHAWIGNRVNILPKVVIEEGGVIAAGAVVTKHCKPFTMYGGIPAKEIRKRNSHLKYTNVTNGIWSFY